MKSNAVFVALGILLSRIAGLVRERVFAHFFGNSDAGDAFKAALKIPNFLQNLFGEGVLSASFIPVYAELLAKKHDEDAAKVASVIGSLLFVVTSMLVLVGVFLTPALIDLIAPGFEGEKRQLTIQIVQILFPGSGLLVMSAWCLGILNSHRRFFLSYVAPVIWNLTIIATLVMWGKHQTQFNLAMTTSWGLLAGSFLQFAIQVPTVLRLQKKMRPRLSLDNPGVGVVIKNFIPGVISRGVVQVSAYIDNMIASFLPMGAVSSLAYAQTLYLLPVSLFGMSISASELPEMSRVTGNHEDLRVRLNRGLAQISFLVIPSIVAFLFFGDLLVGAIFQTGQFDSKATRVVWYILMASSLGLLPSTLGRLYSSVFYSLKDTKTPLKFALIRVTVTTCLGLLFSLYLPQRLGLDASWGVPALAFASGLAGWVEYSFLRRSLVAKIGEAGVPWFLLFKIWSVALVSSAVAFSLEHLIFIDRLHVIVQALVILGVFGLLYFSLGVVVNIEQAKTIVSKILRRLNLA